MQSVYYYCAYIEISLLIRLITMNTSIDQWFMEQLSFPSLAGYLYYEHIHYIKNVQHFWRVDSACKIRTTVYSMYSVGHIHTFIENSPVGRLS